jgi:hypothetical protein
LEMKSGGGGEGVSYVNDRNNLISDLSRACSDASLIYNPPRELQVSLITSRLTGFFFSYTISMC